MGLQEHVFAWPAQMLHYSKIFLTGFSRSLAGYYVEVPEVPTSHHGLVAVNFPDCLGWARRPHSAQHTAMSRMIAGCFPEKFSTEDRVRKRLQYAKPGAIFGECG